MAIRRLRTFGTPRPQSQPPSEVDTLAYWMAQTEQARNDPTGRHLWRLYTSPTFADLWYEARIAGERFRASAVAALYARRQQPGGLYPDPRQSAAFSERAIVFEAARQLGISVWQQPPCSQHDPREPLVWLMTYPRQQRTPPTLMVHAETTAVPQGLQLFQMACMLGFITREQSRMLDPDGPHGLTPLPSSPSALSVMHQFAFAFLYLEPRCPPEWHCHCASIRQQYNAPPRDHAQPTDTLSLADLRAQLRPERPEWQDIDP